ncbi:hypothetical protein PWT90_08253 [Aphanocladium album]|nr:hypothetical protein PWT90_08253 [Aphanocladium album]
MPSLSNMGSRRESWPPTQLRLVRSGSNKSLEPRPLLEDIDEDPLTYFLTPSADDDDEDSAAFSDDDDALMDFDAGIEIAGQPRDITRSVSPSTLDGLRKLGLGGGHQLHLHRRAVSPDFDSDGLTSDDDDDGEDYVRFSPSPPPAPIRTTRSPGSLLSAMPRHSFSGAFGFRSRSPVLGARAGDGFLSPASSFPAPSRPFASTAAAAVATAGLRGRSTFASSRRGRSIPSASARVSRPGHLWREPSADVWSIEEETEEELMMSEMLGGIPVSSGTKPIKRVRFVLPGEQ